MEASWRATGRRLALITVSNRAAYRDPGSALRKFAWATETRAADASIAQSEVAARFGKPTASWRLRARTIIFESDTRTGRWFDLLLIVAIIASVVVVVLDSVHSVTTHAEAQFCKHCGKPLPEYQQD